MYLPEEIPGARVLITVKTYPQPSSKYSELVCTAGLLDGKWIRIYPVPFREMLYKDQYSKYHWITLDLVKNYKDLRIESYRPKHGIDGIHIGSKVGTKNGWSERKRYVLKESFTSMSELISLAKNEKRSLGTLKPSQIVDFVIEPQERKWKKAWRDQLLQYNLFDLDEQGQGKKRSVIRKLPYKYSYEFLSEGDKNPRKLMIEDWEIGALYWRCLRSCGGDEEAANRLVRAKYFEEFCSQKDLYLFLGTTLAHHFSPSPFIIIGVFFPPKLGAEQLSLFE